jgi:hypothetical protein
MIRTTRDPKKKIELKKCGFQYLIVQKTKVKRLFEEFKEEN